MIPNYYLATNKAYEVLEKTGCFDIPVPVHNIIGEYSNIRIMSYTDIAKIQRVPFEAVYYNAPSVYGWTIRENGTNRALILYNDLQPEYVIRFTLAHELGHCLLNHTSYDITEEKEANCFARNLLCPVPVVQDLGIQSANDYSNSFNVSKTMGEVARDFMACDLFNISRDNYSYIKDKTFMFYSGYTYSDIYGVPA